MGTTKLEKLRGALNTKNASFQRNYNYSLYSTKLALLSATFEAEHYIQSVEHSFITYENQGEYHGFLAKATKPSEINITFIEDDTQTISRALDMWDNLKYDKGRGIFWPKACYEDEAILTYSGATQITKLEKIFEAGDKKNINFDALANGVRWLLIGFYPIMRQSQTLSDGDNSILQISVSFNVDDVKMFV